MDFDNQAPMDALCEKWDPLLEHDALPQIEDSYKKKVTAQLLENQEKALREQYLQEAPNNSMGGNFDNPQLGAAGNLAGYDPRPLLVMVSVKVEPVRKLSIRKLLLHSLVSVVLLIKQQVQRSVQPVV